MTKSNWFNQSNSSGLKNRVRVWMRFFKYIIMDSYIIDAAICTNEKMLKNYFHYAEHFGPIKKRKYKNIEYWMTLFSDTTGFQIDIYYPKNAEPGEKIKVIVISNGTEKHIIEWIHERPGLIVEKIYPFIIDMLF